MRRLLTQFLFCGLCGLCGWGSPGAVANEAGDTDWPKFRGPAGDGVVVAANELPPLKWSTSERVTWRSQLAGSGWSSPVVVGDEVLITGAEKVPGAPAEARALVLYRLDRNTGELRETIKVFDQSAEDSPGIHSKNSHASPTPWVSAEQIFVHFGYQGTAALDRGGKLQWVNRDLRFPPVHGNGGSPVLVGDRLIFTCDGADSAYVVALSAASGEVLWKRDRPVDAARKFSFCTPSEINVDGQTQVICPGSDCVLALNPEDGSIIWQIRYDGYSVVPKPVYADGLVFIGTGFGPTQVMAIDPRGQGDVTDTHVRWTLDRGAPKTPSLLADEGLLYVVSDDGILTVLETVSGDQVYKQRLGGKYSASPVLVGERIYLPSEEGVVRVLQAGREFRELAANEMDERILASPAVVQGELYLRTDKAVYRIE
ncbi:PQQ-binding-like beta-propeller repeat protein [Planctomycetaceae bacterium SH139]